MRSVPVVMFHGVAPDLPSRPPQMDHWLEPRVFERYLESLRRDGFETLFLDELRAYRAGTRSIRDRAVVLTFDDGYLDFWLYVFPLLRAYDMKATVFVTTDFIDGDGPPRTRDGGVPWGFVSWTEMREMVRSGHVQVQSHAMTHTWYPTGPALTDVHRPELPWATLRHLWWNRFPEKKPRWYALGSHRDLPWGLPVLEHRKALLAKRYLVNPELESRLVAYVANEGGEAFFTRTDWRDRYRARFEEIRGAIGEIGAAESDAERRARVAFELAESRRILGQGLGTDVRYLCCPGGSLDEEVLAIAREVGYDAVSVPRWFERGLNRPGGDLHRFYRVPSTSPFARIRSAGADAFAFRMRVHAELGSRSARTAWTLLGGLRRLRCI